MALADGKAEARACCGMRIVRRLARPVPVIQPVVDSISGFIAVIPAEPSAELELLAAEATKAFDPFRAPLSPEDRARRNPDKLTPRQRDYLDRWGYPYVMEEFRFHMTLTGRLPAERREAVSWRCCASGLRQRASAGSRSTRLPCAARKLRTRGFGSLAAGNCRNDGPACQTQNIENNPMQSRIGAPNGPSSRPNLNSSCPIAAGCRRRCRRRRAAPGP